MAPADPAELPPVTVTPAAAAEIRRNIAELQMPGPLYLRVRVVPGGCQGFMHKLDLDPAVSAEDRTFESGGVSVVVLGRQAEMLRGTRVDYGEEDGRRGLTVENPNFQGECGNKWLPVLRQETDVK